MKVFNGEWIGFIRFAETFEHLSEEDQEFLLSAEPRGRLHAGAIGMDALVDAGFLQRYAHGRDCRLSEEFRPVHRTLVAMGSCPLDETSEDVYCHYAAMHLSASERNALVGSSERGWNEDFVALRECMDLPFVDQFIRARDVAKWESARSVDASLVRHEPVSYMQSGTSGKDAQRLVQALLKARGPVRFVDLADFVNGEGAPKGSKIMSMERLEGAIQAAVRYLLVLPWMHEGITPVIGIWPPILAQFYREKIAEPKPIVDDKLVWHSEPLGLFDIEAVLVRASKPLRTKSDGTGLYAAELKTIGEALVAMPSIPGASRLFRTELDARVALAVRDAFALGFLAFERGKGKGGHYELTHEGKEWLRLSLGDKLAHLIDEIRNSDVVTPGLHSVTLTSSMLAGDYDDDPSSTLKAREVLASIPSDGALALRDFLLYEGTVSNPLLSPRRAFQYGAYRTLHEREHTWIKLLMRGLVDSLVRFGVVAGGVLSDGEVVIRSTPWADYFFGRSGEVPVMEAVAEGPPIRVQSDFDIMFLAPSAAVESEIAAFAERTGQGLGAIFRLTPDSIRRGALAGLTVEAIVSVLETASGLPLPDNVAYEIAAWHGSTVELKYESAVIIRCPDPETAARVMSAGGKSVELLGDRTLVVTEPKNQAKVKRACEKQGVFIQALPKPPAKKAKKRSRRHYW